MKPSDIQRTIEISVTITPEELAKAFWWMSDSEQVEFFNALGAASEARLPFQLQFVTDNPTLTTAGRYAMSLIGDYSQKIP
jgi:hypothetical protein